MCAIAGSSNDRETYKMLELMKHRAPEGLNVVDGIGMGLLSITGSSPFPFEEDGYILTFNGEIYNYIELREELEQLGHSFRTSSDTEILFRAYLHWGSLCLDKFNGMFAFAIKHPDGSIFLARDIAGEKPLYYQENPFKFASEAKALGWDCKELPPAHYAVVENGKVTLTRYWTPKKVLINPQTAENDLERLLEDAVRIRTQTEHPYALFYSGGVDSTLINSYCSPQELITYDNKDRKEEYLKLFNKLLWHLDYPIYSFSAFALWKLAEEAKQKGFKIVISGEGADELFGGYVRYVPHSLGREARRHFPSYPKYFPEYEDANKLGWKEFNSPVHLRELLRMGDRMTAAHGIENRCPFLDKRIIEFAFSLPHEAKIDGFTTKKILRRVLSKRIPSYQHVEKHGLFVDVNKWLGVDDPFDKETYFKVQMKQWQKHLAQSSPRIKTTRSLSHI